MCKQGVFEMKTGKKKKIGLLGGTFNPVHNGHLNIAKELLRKKIVNEVWFLPVYMHTEKTGKMVSFEERVEMVRLVLEKGMKVSEFEKDLYLVNKNKNYSVETIRSLKMEYPEYEFKWIVGENLLDEIPRWEHSNDFLDEVQLIVYPIGIKSLKEIKENKVIKRNKSLIATGVKMQKVSSTEIREKMKKKKDIKDLVPEKVLNYIKKKKFYAK